MLIRSLASLALISSISLSALAVEFYDLAPQHPSLTNPVWMKNAVQVKISPRGQKLFSENLVQVLSNLGVVINENYFPEFQYVSAEPIKIDKLAEDQPEQFEILMQVRQFFRQYLKGIQFKDFKPSIRLGPSEYVAQFDRLALVADEDLMEQLGKKDGAVLAVELSITSLKALANQVDAKDLENSWLGQVGVTEPSLQIGTKAAPLKARMPFYVKADGGGGLHFEALKVEENLDIVPIEVGYRKLILPEFEFKVVGQEETHKISLDEKEFKKIVDQHLPKSLELVRKYVRDYLQTEFPKLLNERAQSALKDDLEQIQSVPAAGTLPQDTRPPLSLGLRLSDMNLRDSHLQINLSAFVEDTSIQGQAPFWKRSEARGAPVFNHLSPENYDLAIAVDRALLNRLVQLSFNRKNFKELETCPGSPKIELLSPPAIDYASPQKNLTSLEAMMSVYIDASIPSPKDQTGGLFSPLKEKLHIKFRYLAIVRPVAPGSATLAIYPTGADLKTLQVDDDSLTWVGRLAKGKVVKEIGKVLSEGSSCGSSGPLGEFELINSLWGVPIEYVKLKTDSQGQLMLYMNYKNKSSHRQEGL